MEEKHSNPLESMNSNDENPPVSNSINKSVDSPPPRGDHKFTFHGSSKQYLGLSLYNLLSLLIIQCDLLHRYHTQS